MNTSIIQDYLKICQLYEELDETFNQPEYLHADVHEQLLIDDHMRIKELEYDFFAKYGVTYDEFKLNYRGYLK